MAGDWQGRIRRWTGESFFERHPWLCGLLIGLTYAVGHIIFGKVLLGIALGSFMGLLTGLVRAQRREERNHGKDRR